MKREQQRNLRCCSSSGPAVVARLQDGVHKLIHSWLVIVDKISCCNIPLFVSVSITTTRAEQRDVTVALGPTPRSVHLTPTMFISFLYVEIEAGLLDVVLPVAALPCRYQVTTQRLPGGFGPNWQNTLLSSK